jgi:hypothetical protein
VPIKVSNRPKGTSFVGIRLVAMVKNTEMGGQAHSDLAGKISLMTIQVVR